MSQNKRFSTKSKNRLRLSAKRRKPGPPKKKYKMAEPRQFRSTVWTHFKRLEKKGKCRYCNLEVAISAGSTSNLRRHLQKLHPTVAIDSERPRSRSRSSSPSASSTTTEQPSLLASILTNRPPNSMASTNSLHARRTSSYHWNHFIRLDFTKAKCRYCHRVIKMSRGSTGNLNRHIRLKHPSIVKGHSLPVPPPSIPEYDPGSPENLPGEVECIVYGCKNKRGNCYASKVTFHQFPVDENERQKWILAMRKEKWKPSKRSVICSKHFKEDDFDRSPFYTKLKPGALPSIFDSNSKCGQPEMTQVRIHEDDNDKSASDDQSTCDRFVIQPNTSVAQCSTTYQPPEKRQRMTFDIVRKGTPYQNKDEDEFSVMGRHIANKLRKLPSETLPVVEKLITDVIFEAQCGNVSQTSRIAFYDMMNPNLRNLQQANQTNNLQAKVPQENENPVKAENQSSMSPNIVFLLPQSDVSKTLPLNVQVVQAKAEVQNKNGEQHPQSNEHKQIKG